MNEQMTFPNTWEEYERLYGFDDEEQIYTNGSRLIPTFRVKQWLEHLPSAEPLTDAEQRIFLKAMGREEEVCKIVDEEYKDEGYKLNLVHVCQEIIRKVKGALWT